MIYSSYQLILNCWKDRPEHRPTFTQQVESFSTLLDSMADYLDFFTISNPIAQNAMPSPSPTLSHGAISTPGSVVPMADSICPGALSDDITTHSSDVITTPTCVMDTSTNGESVELREGEIRIPFDDLNTPLDLSSIHYEDITLSSLSGSPPKITLTTPTEMDETVLSSSLITTPTETVNTEPIEKVTNLLESGLCSLKSSTLDPQTVDVAPLEAADNMNTGPTATVDCTT